jgi:hypothetical protein
MEVGCEMIHSPMDVLINIELAVAFHPSSDKDEVVRHACRVMRDQGAYGCSESLDWLSRSRRAYEAYRIARRVTGLDI